MTPVDPPPPARPPVASHTVPARRVLLVEDTAVIQKVVVGLLAKRGHTVAVAGNGQEALAALDREAFDVVLMDVHMPVMDGFEATAEIRRREQAAGGHLTIIAMTADASPGDQQQCLAAGMDGSIAKPIQPQELFQAVEHSSADARSAPASDVINWGTAVALIPGGPHVVRELVQTLLDTCPQLMQDIRQALASGDAKALHRGAHTLRGSAEIFGAQRVAEAAGRLERMGRDKDLAHADAALLELETEVARLIAALQDFLGGHGRKPH